jgi:hypothetical protein
MNVSYQYDQDPRYGWAEIDVGDSKDSLIVVSGNFGGSLGFTFDGEKMVPTCICNARYSGECCCPNVSWSDGLY